MSLLSGVGQQPSALGTGTRTIYSSTSSITLTSGVTSTLLTVSNIPYGIYLIFYRNIFNGVDATVITSLSTTTTLGNGEINTRDFIYSPVDLNAPDPEFIIQYVSNGTYVSALGTDSLVLTTNAIFTGVGSSLECLSTSLEFVRLA